MDQTHQAYRHFRYANGRKPKPFESSGIGAGALPGFVEFRSEPFDGPIQLGAFVLSSDSHANNRWISHRQLLLPVRRVKRIQD